MKAGTMKITNRFIAVILGIMLSNTVSAAQNALIATSGYTKVELIELYTSESCSSCPPADIWFSNLKTNSNLWKHFVPVAFHVDYWNHLGWKDDYSSAEMTKRQVSVARLWGGGAGVYTPAVVRDAKEWKDWRHLSDRQIPISTEATHLSLSVFRQPDGEFLVKVDGLKGDHHYILRVAKLGMNLSSTVTSGENSGKLLRHDFVVLDWISKSVNEQHSQSSFRFKDLSKKSSHFAVAAWIEEENNPSPLQAVGAYL
jgi:hypothetical protein